MTDKSSVLLSWKGDVLKGTLGGTLAFDAVTNETYDGSVTVTEYPVESGANVSDHIRRNPLRVTLECWVTDTPHTGDNLVTGLPRGALAPAVLTLPEPPPPSGLLALTALVGRALGFSQPSNVLKAQLLQFAAPFSAIVETLDVLNKLQSEGQLLDVITRDWFADSMVIESISKPRAVGDGSLGHFNLGLKSIRVVETRVTAAAIPAEPRAKSKVDAGKKDGSDSATAKKSSLLAKGAKYLGVIP